MKVDAVADRALAIDLRRLRGRHRFPGGAAAGALLQGGDGADLPAGGGLFPAAGDQLLCSCPDYAAMCKHVAAVLYGIGARLDRQPELLFRLRGVDETELIAGMDAGLPMSSAAPAADKVLISDDLSALFGLDMAVPAEPRRAAAKPVERDAATRTAKSAKPGAKPGAPRGAGFAKVGAAAALPTSGRLDRLPRRWAPSRSRPDGRLQQGGGWGPTRVGFRPGSEGHWRQGRAARPVRRAGAQAAQGSASAGNVPRRAAVRCAGPGGFVVEGARRCAQGQEGVAQQFFRRQGDLRHAVGEEEQTSPRGCGDGGWCGPPTPVNCSELAHWPESLSLNAVAMGVGWSG